MTQWYGLMVPSRWNKANTAKLEAEAIKAARGTAVKEKLAQETALAVGNTDYLAFVKDGFQAAAMATWMLIGLP